MIGRNSIIDQKQALYQGIRNVIRTEVMSINEVESRTKLAKLFRNQYLTQSMKSGSRRLYV